MPPWCGTPEEAELLTDYLMSIAPPRPAGMLPSSIARREEAQVMDPQMLIDHGVAPACPAPFWFVEFFKVLGLHAARGADEPLVCRHCSWR